MKLPHPAAAFVLILGYSSACLAADQPLKPAAAPAKAAIPVESVTYLGITTQVAPRMVTDQLGLPPDIGLVVNAVASDSPAASVLKTSDLLLRIDDQKLIETRQLAVLIRGHKEGDEVTLAYVRAGKEATAKIKLTKHEATNSQTSFYYKSVVDAQGLQNIDRRMQDLRAQAEAEAKVLKSKSDKFNFETDQKRELLNQELDRVRQQQKDGTKPQGMNLPVPALPRDITVYRGDTQTVLSDRDGSIDINVSDGHKKVVARNAAGSVIFSGPFDTNAERKAAPETIQKRIDEIETLRNLSARPAADFEGRAIEVLPPAPLEILYKLPTVPIGNF